MGIPLIKTPSTFYHLHYSHFTKEHRNIVNETPTVFVCSFQYFTLSNNALVSTVTANTLCTA